jgi:hypothetical protein
VRYWVATAGLIAFGLVGMLSIGRPFLLVGLAMLALGRLRSRPAAFWPPLVAVIAYNVGYWATAPLYCTATQSIDGAAQVGASTTVCSSLLGVSYSGPGIYNPSLDPANGVGIVLAAVAFVVVLAATLRNSRARRVEPGT